MYVRVLFELRNGLLFRLIAFLGSGGMICPNLGTQK